MKHIEELGQLLVHCNKLGLRNYENSIRRSETTHSGNDSTAIAASYRGILSEADRDSVPEWVDAPIELAKLYIEGEQK